MKRELQDLRAKLHQQRAELEQLRLQALEDRAEADLRLGGQDRLIPELRELAARHPVRERFHPGATPAWAAKASGIVHSV